MVLKLKPKINLKIMQKGSKILKIMKGSRNSKKYIFTYKQTRNVGKL